MTGKSTREKVARWAAKICVPLTTRPSTLEQVAILSREKHKNPNFEKYSKYFSRLGHWPTNDSQKISMWACDWGATRPTCDWVTRTRQHCFWRFWKFLQKQNTFQKQLKTQKSFCDWSTKIEHMKTHLIKYNYTNEYGIHWTCVVYGYQK